jgi:hypothetical protein
MRKLVNKIYGTHPSIIHCPCKHFRNQFLLEGIDPFWPKTLRQYKKLHFKKPDEVKIITFNNRNYKSLLEKNLDFLCLDYLVLGKEIKNWTNRQKIRLLRENLDQVSEEFILVLDADDVAIISSLEDIVEKFLSFECEVLFNADAFPWPTEPAYMMLEEAIHDGPFRYLNSGCFFGKTKFCKNLFFDCMYYKDKITESNKYSDQVKLKLFYIKNPKIKIDHKCQIFQVITINYNEFVEI